MSAAQPEPVTPERFRARTRPRLQMEASECGAASLGIVLAHYGRWVPLEELRDACGISRDGSTAIGIKRAAEHYGMSVTARRCDPDTLKRHRMPAIVFWSFDHWLVVEGWCEDGWYLSDPGNGRHRLCSNDEFDELFTGIALIMAPGEGFVRSGRAPRVLRRIGAHLIGSRDGAILMGLLGVLLIVPQILIPGLARLFVDWLAGGPPVVLTTLLAALALAAVLQAVLIGLQNSVGMRLATKLSVVLQAKMMARLLQLPAAFHAMRGPATLAQRATQPEAVAATVSGMFSTLVVGVISSTTAVLLLVLTYPPAGLVAVLVLGVIIAALFAASRRRRALAMRMIREQIDAGKVSVSSLSQMEVIKASGAEDHAIGRWTAAHNRLLAAVQQLGERTTVTNLLPGFFLTVGNVAVTIVGLIGVANDALTLGGFVAVQTLLGAALAPAVTVVAQVQQAEWLPGQLDQIDDVLATPLPARTTPRKGPTPAVLSGEVRLRSLTFGYDPNRPPLLRDFDLTLAPGARIALVGPSGCGKSTVSRLLVGLYAPWEGEILIDGRPRAEWPEPVLTQQLAIVNQDPVIFEGSFRDNLTLWDPTIGEADVIRAAVDAALHDDIARRPGSYDARLRQGGTDLSGGQRQRLEIARAFVRDPAILVFDEATSALDAATEAHIDAAIRRRGASCLIIAHRLSTVRDADEIIVMDRGLVVERGCHEDLVRAGGHYERLVTTA